MSIVVFAGPTIPAREITARLDCTVLPPAAVGDVLRATRGGARLVLLIDGVFERQLPVWHKEILWALTRGVHVWGAASMGALRAAELHTFGMRGVGRIFEGYRDGTIEADDEVAVLHGPVEVGFAPVTEALVNVRATLDAAAAEGALDPEEARTALAAAARLNYRDRTWERVAAELGAAGIRLRAWLPAGRVDRKRLDALEVLDQVAASEEELARPFAASFAFAWTDPWDALFRGTGGSARDEAVLDELRLDPRRLATVRRAALLRLLVRGNFPGCVADPGREELATARDALRARHGLWRGAELRRWLAEQDLGEDGLVELTLDEALLARLEGRGGGALDAAMLAELKSSGAYAALAARARAKTEALSAAGVEDALPAHVDPAPILAALAARLDIGDETDAAALALRLGFADGAALKRAALREGVFLGILQP